MKQNPPHTVEALQSEAFMEHAIEHHRGAVLRLALARRVMRQMPRCRTGRVHQLLRSAHEVPRRRSSARWSPRATHDSCVDLHRQAWRRRVETREDMVAVTDRETWDPAIEEVVNHPVWTAMERLPESLRARCTFHHVEGYGIAEVADISGRTEAGGLHALHRGRKKLAAELDGFKQQGPHPPAHPWTRTTRPTPQCSRPHIREEPRLTQNLVDALRPHHEKRR